MSNLLESDIAFLDDLLEMHTGFVLDFTSRSFTRFFDELGIDIDSPQYTRQGRSKAKRMRCFLRTSDKSTLIRVLDALCRYRESRGWRSDRADTTAALQRRLQQLLDRLHARAPDLQVGTDGAAGSTASRSAFAAL